jgi:hypothetical protein
VAIDNHFFTSFLGGFMAGDILTLISSVEILAATGIVYSYYAFHEGVYKNMAINKNMDDNKHVDDNNRIAGIKGENAKNSEWYQLGLPIVTNYKLRSLKGQAYRKFFNIMLGNKHSNNNMLADHIVTAH